MTDRTELKPRLTRTEARCELTGFRCVRKIAKNDYVCPSVGMEQLGSHLTDFHEI